MIKYRTLEKNDNIDLIADWIYQTDTFEFNQLFSNKQKSLNALKMLITSDITNPYNKKFMTIIYDENSPNEIQGIVLSFKGDSFTLKERLMAYYKTGYSNLLSIFINPIINHFICSNVKENDYYIGNLYVNSNYRKHNLGSKLVEFCKNKAKELNCNNVLLDVEYKKETLLEFYKKLGFIFFSKKYYNVFGKIYGCKGMKYSLK